VDDPCIYVRQISPQIEEFVKKEGLPVRVISDWGKVVGGDPLKLLFIGQAAVLLELREALKGLPATVVRSERNYLEVLPPGISKGTGLVWLCEWLGIPLERVVAVGDQESDVSMFERVGLGVTMAHAPEIVRRKAHITISAIPELQKLLGANAAS
jgi:hydroxymethylpyrimidine pyrophosphatase-like HAD family hydrolase